MSIFLKNLNTSWLFASPVSFLQSLGGREDPAPTLDALDTGVSILHRLISLHYTAQHTLSSRNTRESSKIKFNAFSVEKKSTFLPNTTHLTSLCLGCLQQGSQQHRHRGAGLQDDWEERQQQGREVVSRVHGWERQASSHSQDSIWRVTRAAFRSQLAPSSGLSLLPLSACVQCALW